ncbi:branched-chain amino acid ABC transporter permease [Halocalculus aciditolerans]|uniref:Branched-chain amino acid ABC transporter permease n=1 Tax=Halocalculus aciditolerans TaxID=1383812 RepID=A0A830FMK8_9EURY|nr:branched-chain amino acid ABC transporter permease [Halocalculus aciditolerans]GGL67597.1 branched-chain amino acid ABC transporter permease [Halocalculus aciditolerans]
MIPAFGAVLLPLSMLSRFVDPFSAILRDVLGLNPVLLQLVAFALLLGGVYALTALGLTMIFGVMDVINFAHGIFLVVGMYTTLVVTTTFGVNPFLAIGVAVVVLFVLGVVMHLSIIEPILDAPDQNQLIVTLGALFVIQSVIEIGFGPDPQSIGFKAGTLEVAGVFIPNGRLYALALAILAMVVVWAFLQYTDLGREIRGTANNRIGAQYVGINVTRINYLTFGIGAALAGLAGGSVALFNRFDPFSGSTYLINAFVIVVLGGLGSFPGAFLGGMIIGFLQVFGSYYLPGTTYQILIFLLFIGTLLVKPEGIFGGESA